MTLLLLLTGAAFAVRPTEGGLFRFDPSDVIEFWDEPTEVVRVHYSVDGPNVVRAGDVDEDGVPGFVREVGERAADALDHFAHALGLRPPVSEEALGLGPLGGSYAFDFYLVDFGGSADGTFGIDGCTEAPRHCAGHMVMENDFRGYGYASISEAIEVLTSHELFHAVQAAYDAGQPVWFSEGTAVWAELQVDPASRDFRAFANRYLEDVGRSLDRPPVGPVPAFAYATALFWAFLTERHGVDLMAELLEATEAPDGVPVDTLRAVAGVLEGRGEPLSDAFATFVSWNLATGARAGSAESYPFARDLRGIGAEAEGATIEDDNRFYPLAATYYRIDHPGGDLWFGSSEDAPLVRFALHPVRDGAADGPVEDAVARFTAANGVARIVAEALPPGGYWIAGTYPEIDTQSQRMRVCLGDREAASVCAPLSDPPPEPGGCGCNGAGPMPRWLLLPGLAVLWRRQSRRTQDSASPERRASARQGKARLRAP